jgi:ribosome biogenesis GTPase
MREIGILAAGEGIDGIFADIVELSGGCRFADCTHASEPGCAVLAAVEAGRLDKERYRNYRKLKKESDFHEMSYVERRKRDRAFGRMVKSVMKRKPS